MEGREGERGKGMDTPGSLPQSRQVRVLVSHLLLTILVTLGKG